MLLPAQIVYDQGVSLLLDTFRSHDSLRAHAVSFGFSYFASRILHDGGYFRVSTEGGLPFVLSGTIIVAKVSTPWYIHSRLSTIVATSGLKPCEDVHCLHACMQSFRL